MRYTVFWVPAAERELAEIWLRHPDRRSVENAANNIDRLLATLPGSAAETQEGVVRIGVCEPLAVTFNVSPDDCRVDVLEIWILRRTKT